MLSFPFPILTFLPNEELSFMTDTKIGVKSCILYIIRSAAMLFGCIESPYADVSKLLLKCSYIYVAHLFNLVNSSRSQLLCKTHQLLRFSDYCNNYMCL